jgi:hypothetical protein
MYPEERLVPLRARLPAACGATPYLGLRVASEDRPDGVVVDELISHRSIVKQLPNRFDLLM